MENFIDYIGSEPYMAIEVEGEKTQRKAYFNSVAKRYEPELKERELLVSTVDGQMHIVKTTS